MESHEIRDNCRSNFNEHLRKAFKHIPPIENMNILDMGCGTGVSVLEIAKITDSRITAIDLNKNSLEILEKKIKSTQYEERILVIRSSIETAILPEKSFYIILAEGLFNIIGFKNGLMKYSRLLANNGYFIIHDELKDEEMKLQFFKKSNFKLIISFILDEKIWWDKYCGCMEKQIEIIKNTKPINTDLDRLFKREISEIEMYKENPLKFRSIYHVIRKENKS